MTAATTTAAPTNPLNHDHGSAVPVQTRSERLRSITPADFAAVTGREVDWKYTPVARLADLIDGSLDGSATPVEPTLAEGVSATWSPVASVERGRAGLPEDRASANAWQSTAEVLTLRITAEEAGESVLRRADLGSVPRAAHTVIEAAPNSRGTVVLQNSGTANLVENLEILVGGGAQLTVVSIQEWADDAVHLASHFARIGRDATLRHIVISLGGSIVRINPSAHLAEQGGDAELSGLYFSESGQHLEQQVFVNHDAPQTRSRVNYKGALNGVGARSVWIGDVLIGRVATGTDSYEQNRNLVLSDGTRADSVPNLEIETGDIAGAGHASATGRFDDEQLFYLQARGIPEAEARRLVVLGFLSEILQQIPAQETRSRLLTVIESALAQAGDQA